MYVLNDSTIRLYLNEQLLFSEQEILREEIRSLEMVRAKMGEKIKELETELKTVKEKFEEAKRAGEEGEVRLFLCGFVSN